MIRAFGFFLLLVILLAPAPLQAESFRREAYPLEAGRAGGAETDRYPKPDYPIEFRRRYESATMILRIYVAKTGRIDQVELEDFAGSTGLTNYAVNFARKNWSTAPIRTVAGRPVKYSKRVPVTYLVSGGLKELNAAVRARNSPILPEVKQP